MADMSWVSAIVTGGVGAAIGSIAAAGVQVFGKRGESRATAADLVTTAAGRMVGRLDHDNEQLREALLLIIDALDDVIVSDLRASPAAMEKLRRAKRAAQRAI